MKPFRVRDIVVRLPCILRYNISTTPSRIENRIIGTDVILMGNARPASRLGTRVRGCIGREATPCGCPHVIIFGSDLPGAMDNGVREGGLWWFMVHGSWYMVGEVGVSCGQVALLYKRCNDNGAGITIGVTCSLGAEFSGITVTSLSVMGPCFHAGSDRGRFRRGKVRLVYSRCTNDGISVPTLPTRVCSVASRGSGCTMVSINNSSHNTLTLNEVSPTVGSRGGCRVLFMVGYFEPLAHSTTSAVRIVGRVRGTTGVGFATVIGGSGLNRRAAGRSVLGSMDCTSRVTRVSKLPVGYASICGELCRSLGGRVPGLFPLRLRGGVGWRKILWV